MTTGAMRDAPAPKTVGALLAVPIDVTAVTSRIEIDAASSTASATATVAFTAGGVDGNPVLDLRQPVTAVSLDGVALPLTSFAHHDLGGGAGAEMRILDSVVTAGSAHTLTITYDVGPPQSPAGGSYAPALSYAAGPRVRLSFGFTDLAAARYLEAWAPANLLYDQYSVDIELVVIGTTVPHTVITNATTTSVGANHWQLHWPASSTAMSTLVELRATDAVVGQTGSVVLPVSGRTVSIEAWKLTGGPAVLATEIGNIATHLTDNENTIGPYPHGSRFVAFFNTGGMEYDGGTTTAPGNLRHETHHSWWARGWRPASQPDGWLDEGWTVYHDNGSATVTPFDFTDPPVTLRPANPWVRVTSGNAYGDGSRLFEGLAGLVGVSSLLSAMRAFWARELSQPSTTVRLEEFLVSRTGDPRIVDAFHRFAYGLADSTPAADLWLRDDPAHTGSDPWSGRFWDSPDLWIRNADDGGTTHQEPERGQDNFFYARIRNRSTTQTARHAVVTFAVHPWAGIEFSYPSDWLPAISAAAAFDIAPGGEQVVRAKWPRALVPPTGTHACWLAAVLSRGDSPAAGLHTWQSNGLAQKNMTIVDLQPDTWWTLPFVTAASLLPRRRALHIELRRPAGRERLTAMLVQSSGLAFDPALSKPVPGELAGALISPRVAIPGLPLDLDAGPHSHAPAVHLPNAHALEFAAGLRPEVRVAVPRSAQLSLGLALRVPADAVPGEVFDIDLVARGDHGGPIVGGLAVQVRVVAARQADARAARAEDAAGVGPR